MDAPTIVKLPSGAELKITLAPFEDAKNLYQAILEEAKGVDIKGEAELGNICKDVLCVGFSSKKIEAALMKCIARCTYNGLRIGAETFEPAEAREDYFEMLFVVAEANIRPFTKNLYAKFSQVLGMLANAQA